MTKYILLISLLALIFSISTPAYAYLDPGTGSVLIQGLLAGLVSALAVLKLYWQKIKHFIFRSKKSSAQQPPPSVCNNDESK